MAFDLARPFHVAQVVTDLEHAMDEAGAALGLTWNSVQHRTMRIRWQDDVVETSLRFTYSRGSEPYFELLQGEPGSVWGPDFAGMHHVGVWTDEFQADAGRLEASGFPIEATLAGKDDTPQGFTYQTSRHGLRIELVPVELKPAFDRWFAGGEFG
jgi:hypothetical protein